MLICHVMVSMSLRTYRIFLQTLDSSLSHAPFSIENKRSKSSSYVPTAHLRESDGVAWPSRESTR